MLRRHGRRDASPVRRRAGSGLGWRRGHAGLLLRHHGGGGGGGGGRGAKPRWDDGGVDGERGGVDWDVSVRVGLGLDIFASTGQVGPWDAMRSAWKHLDRSGQNRRRSRACLVHVVVEPCSHGTG